MELEARSLVQLQPEVCQARCGGQNSNCLHKCGRLESQAVRTGPLGLLWPAVPLLHRRWASVLAASSAKQVSPVLLAWPLSQCPPCLFRCLPRGGGCTSPVSLQLGDTGGWDLKSRGPWDGPGLSQWPSGQARVSVSPRLLTSVRGEVGMTLMAGEALSSTCVLAAECCPWPRSPPLCWELPGLLLAPGASPWQVLSAGSALSNVPALNTHLTSGELSIQMVWGRV